MWSSLVIWLRLTSQPYHQGNLLQKPSNCKTKSTDGKPCPRGSTVPPRGPAASPRAHTAALGAATPDRPTTARHYPAGAAPASRADSSTAALWDRLDHKRRTPTHPQWMAPANWRM